MQTIAQLESRVVQGPNSVELQHALAERYFAQGRWEDAARTYRGLASLHTATAALFIDRIRLGAAALVTAATLILVAALIQPALVPGDHLRLATAFRSPAYLAAQLLVVVALALYSCAAISIYKLLSYTRDHRPAFWAMVLSVIGVGLSMPALGIRSFVHPRLAEMFLNGQPDVMAVYVSMHDAPDALVLGAGGHLVTAGLAIFSWVIWRNRGLSRPAVLLLLAGWIGTTAAPAGLPRAAGAACGALVACGGVWLGVSLWRHVATQFDAGMDRSST